MPKPAGALRQMLDRVRRRRPAAVDRRGRRLVLVIDCILNQNSRERGAESFPALNFELVALCHAHQVGILQMPCPEIAALGFRRERPPGQSLRDALDTPPARAVCRRLAGEVADRLAAYLAEGYELLAVLGGNQLSPGCAVSQAKDDGTPENKSGIFIAALQDELRLRCVDAAFRGIRDATPGLLEADLRWLRERIERTPGAD